MTRSAWLAIAALSTAVAGASPARAVPNLIVNGSFEAPSAGGGWSLFANGSVPGWTSNNNELEIDYTPILGGAEGSVAYHGAQSAEVDGSTFDTLSQTVTGLTVGAKYTLSWAYGSRPGSGPQRLDVSFGGAPVATNTSDGSGEVVGWTPNAYTVVATAPSETLSFVARDVGGNPSVGNELDAVSLTAVPEPASLCLIGSGLLGLGLLRRKRG
ncbi:MAG TPA: PEP-CTERM sorting domain-containing protein [Acetobacteraceae bacterium]|nr:PEP-CTERM sorting domain-containing protein [Acetobacteraceae bacterium]